MPKLIDITGQQFGRLTAVRRDVGSRWLCRCACGRETSVLSGNLRRGLQVSCGCQKKDRFADLGRAQQPDDLVGRRFGMLLVLELMPRTGRLRDWRCRCDCGKEKAIRGADLTHGRSRSCGCVSPFRKTHGLSKTARYKAHQSSLRRVRKTAAPSEFVDPIKVLNDGGWHCYLCGVATPRDLRGTRAPNAPEVDHRIPLARGGSHTYANCACICAACNRSKGAKLNFRTAA